MVCFCSTVFEASARKTQRWGWWWWLQLSETRIIWISLHSLIHLLSGIRCWVGFLGGTSGKEPTCQCKRHKRRRFDSWVGKIPWRRAWQPTLVFLSGDSMHRRTWWATVPRVAKSWTQLKWLSMHSRDIYTWSLCMFADWFGLPHSTYVNA